MPFQLQSLAAPRTKLVHVHHHHYPDDVKYTKDDYAEDDYTEDEYTEDEYMEDEYTEDDYAEDDILVLKPHVDESVEDESMEDGYSYTEDEYSSDPDFEYAGVSNSESEHLFTTSSDEISDW